MRNFLLGFILATMIGVAFADLDDNPIVTTVIPERTKISWHSPEFTVNAGDHLIMAVRDSGNNILESVQLGPVAKEFVGVLTLNGTLR